jgi:hypothetical protein
VEPRVSVPAALTIDEVKSILRDIPEPIDEPDSRSVFRAGAKDSRRMSKEDVGEDF